MTFWISTDLDGTLLDHNDYSYAAADPALTLCKELGVPIVLNTSKTEAETSALHQNLNLLTPIIVENGSALIFTKKSLTAKVFGQPRSAILGFIDDMRCQYDIKLSGINDLGVSGIIQHTGLSLEAAELAAQKQYSEPFVWHDSDDKLQELRVFAKQQGLTILKGGRFYHLQGQTDKGKPLLWLKSNLQHLFLSLHNKPKLICLGDNQNDLAMLNVADHPVWVKSSIDPPKFSNKNKPIYTQKIGPEGWNEAVKQLLSTNNSQPTDSIRG